MTRTGKLLMFLVMGTVGFILLYYLTGTLATKMLHWIHKYTEGR